MSSTPVTPGTSSVSQDGASSPPSSPPSSLPSMPASDMDETYDPKNEEDKAMQKEEDKLRKESQRSQRRDAQGKNAGQTEKNMKELEWFLNRSQGFSTAVMDQLKQALAARTAETTSQPRLVTGGQMRDYQLEGVTWLSCLYQVGLNGILADEMGLGKTVQLIAFLAFLREHGTNGPFLILGPLSTVKNWVNEFKRWTPEIAAVMYHGSPQTRAHIRQQQFKGDARGEQFPVVCTSYEISMKDKKYLSRYNWKFIVVDEGHRLKNFNCKLVRELKQYPSDSRLILTGTPLQNNLAELWSLLNFLLPEAFSDLEHFESMFDFSDVQQQDKEGQKEHMDQERRKQTISSLHAILKPFLLRRVKVDVENHLPKKREYILYAPLTPIQREIYRKIKDNDIRSFLEEKAIERISGVDLNSKITSSSSNASKGQKRKAPASELSPANKSTKSSRDSTPASTATRTRNRARKTYTEISDAEYFAQLSDSNNNSPSPEASDPSPSDLVAQKARKAVSAKKLQNPIMQLRLACNSPHHFLTPWSEEEDPDSRLVRESGKMMLLDQLVPHLIEKGHKIILFSQFQKQLDLLEDWAIVLKGWDVCRIDGGVGAEEREEQIAAFNAPPPAKTKSKSKQNDIRLFLLSTRAGGLGINLTSADTVILFDSDWNPQLDLQAQDRAHRIGQVKPVIVYRFATRGTVEETLLERAGGKRRLEKAVMGRGRFKNFSSSQKKKDKAENDKEAEEDEDEEENLLEGEGFEDYDPTTTRHNNNNNNNNNNNHNGTGGDILSAKDLQVLTDRSEAAYARAEKGEESKKFRTVERKVGGVEDGLVGMA